MKNIYLFSWPALVFSFEENLVSTMRNKPIFFILNAKFQIVFLPSFRKIPWFSSITLLNGIVIECPVTQEHAERRCLECRWSGSWWFLSRLPLSPVQTLPAHYRDTQDGLLLVITLKIRVYTEEKAKVVTAAWGTELIQIPAMIDILHHAGWFEERGWIRPILHIVLVQFILFFISS